MPVDKFCVRPIGTFNCADTKKYNVPRQAVLNPKNGLITLEPNLNFEQALDDVSGFSHIWLIYLFDNEKWKPKVQTPRSLIKKGVFATRSPYRPNPIGISLVELVRIQKLTVEIKNYDLLDQTRILDIKPYIHYSDSAENTQAGWLNDVEKFDLTYSDEFYIKLLHYFPEKPTELIDFIHQQLSYAPINHPNKRVKETKSGYVLSYKTYRINFSLKENRITVLSLDKVRDP